MLREKIDEYEKYFAIFFLDRILFWEVQKVGFSPSVCWIWKELPRRRGAGWAARGGTQRGRWVWTSAFTSPGQWATRRTTWFAAVCPPRGWGPPTPPRLRRLRRGRRCTRRRSYRGRRRRLHHPPMAFGCLNPEADRPRYDFSTSFFVSLLKIFFCFLVLSVRGQN